MRVLGSLSSRQRLIAGVAVIGLLVLVVVLALLVVGGQTDAAEEQPLAFNHEIHAQRGIQCQFCHYGVDNSPVAVIPSVELCMGCHEHVRTDSPVIQELTGYWERQEPIPWHRVYEQPSFVYFNHQSHIASGVTCGACHGDVASMSVAEQVVEHPMGFCLDCHGEQENARELYDCAVCHR